jgi:hypothetical protein
MADNYFHITTIVSPRNNRENFSPRHLLITDVSQTSISDNSQIYSNSQDKIFSGQKTVTSLRIILQKKISPRKCTCSKTSDILFRRAVGAADSNFATGL